MPSPALRMRGWAAGVFDGTSLYRRKTGPHPCGPSCALSFAHPPRHRGTGEAACSCAQKQPREQEHPTPALPCTQGRETIAARSLAVALAVAVASGAQDAHLLLGPLGGGEAGTARPRSGHRHGGRCLFAGAGAPSSYRLEAGPGPASRTCRAGRPASANRGGLLFWLLFSWPLKRKVARAPAGARNCFEAAQANKANPPSPHPSPPTVKLSGEREDFMRARGERRITRPLPSRQRCARRHPRPMRTRRPAPTRRR